MMKRCKNSKFQLKQKMEKRGMNVGRVEWGAEGKRRRSLIGRKPIKRPAVIY